MMMLRKRKATEYVGMKRQKQNNKQIILRNLKI